MTDLSIKSENFIAVHVAIENVCISGEETLRVVKSEKINEYDENTYAKYKKIDFKDGIIEVDMRSRLLADAPDFARGFIGIVLE